jgi:hypothetical protein
MKPRIAIASILVCASCAPLPVAPHAPAELQRGAVFYNQFSLVTVLRPEGLENWYAAEASFRGELGRKIVRIRLNGQPLPSTRLEGAVVNADGVLTVLSWDTVGNDLCFRGNGAVRFANVTDRVRLQGGC